MPEIDILMVEAAGVETPAGRLYLFDYTPFTNLRPTALAALVEGKAKRSDEWYTASTRNNHL